MCNQKKKIQCLDCSVIFTEFLSDSNVCPECEGSVIIFECLCVDTVIKIKHTCSQEFIELILPHMTIEQKINNYALSPLDRDMWDKDIRLKISNTQFTPNELLWFINTELEEKTDSFICHVNIKDEIYAVAMVKDPVDNIYFIQAYELDFYDKWAKEYVFIYPVDSSKDSGLTIASFIEELETLIKKYSNI